MKLFLALIILIGTMNVVSAQNNSCVNAITVSSFDYNTTTNTGGNTTAFTGLDPNNACGVPTSTFAGQNAVYIIQPENSTNYIFSVENLGSADVYMSIYNNCDDIGEGCIAGEPVSSFSTNQFTVPLLVGQEYYFVFSAPAQPTFYRLNIEEEPMPPPNDVCGDAIMLPLTVGDQCTTQLDGSLELATLTPNSLDGCGNFEMREVWYEVVAPSSGKLSVELTRLTGFGRNIRMNMQNGRCNLFATIACSGQLSDNQEVMNVSSLTPGNTYSIRVYALSNSINDFSICARTPACVDPRVNVNRSHFCNENDLHEIEVSLVSLGTANEVLVEVFDGILTSASAQLTGPGTVDFTFDAVNSSGNYTVTVSDINTPTCEYEETFTIPPFCPIDNDLCGGAVDLNFGNSYSVSNIVADNITASGSPTTTQCTEDAPDSGAGLWYEFNSLGGEVIITSSLQGGDLELVAFTGPCSFRTCISRTNENTPSAGAIDTETLTLSNTSFAEPIWIFAGLADGVNSITNAQFSISLAFPGSNLPVQLIDFVANPTQKQTFLTWQTASETQNAGFHLQHSTNGQTWSTLDFIPGAGDSRTEQHYEYTHQSPTAGENYYRLEQEDFDGTKMLSDVVTVQFNGASEMVITPNPASDKIFVSSARLTEQTDYQLTVFDATGREVARVRSTSELDVAQFPQGVYTVVLTVQGETVAKRFMRR